jgi:hypothetical protein
MPCPICGLSRVCETRCFTSNGLSRPPPSPREDAITPFQVVCGGVIGDLKTVLAHIRDGLDADLGWNMVTVEVGSAWSLGSEGGCSIRGENVKLPEETKTKGIHTGRELTKYCTPRISDRLKLAEGSRLWPQVRAAEATILFETASV